MDFTVTILGCNSAIPTVDGNPSAQLINHNNDMFMVDCGEGAQKQMQVLKIKSHRINHIFISHLHGDHYLGLMGLLFTYHLTGRTRELHLYAPKELMEIIDLHLKVGNSELSYKLHFHELKTSFQGVIFENEHLRVSSFNLNHRVDTFGFVFREKPLSPNIKKEAIEKYCLGPEDIKNIKAGKPYFDKNGQHIDSHDLTMPARALRSYAYCSDTAYFEDIIPFIKGVDLLYHEATFEEALKEKAGTRFHATAMEAAAIAKKAKVKRLLIGHFSARYTCIELLEREARSVFMNTKAAVEGQKYIIPCVE